MGETVRAHVLVSGSVQGVFFRVSAAQRAGRAGVNGWVRNIADGRVEAVFEGERHAVEECVEWCSSGPPGASVDRVEVEWEQPAAEPGFRVR
jgi:acylphosphatase